MTPEQIKQALYGTRLDNELIDGTAAILAAMHKNAIAEANASAASAWLKAASMLDGRFDAPAGDEETTTPRR